MKVRRHHPRGRDHLEQLGREVGGQDRGEAQPAERGHPILDGAHQPGQAPARGEVPAVVAEVDPGQRDLAVAGLDESPDLVDHGRRGLAPARPARRRHDAEGAPVLAAVLHLDEGARAAGDARERRGGDGAGAGHVAHLDPRAGPLRAVRQQLGQPVLLQIAQHEVHPGDARHRLGVDLGQAPRHHQQRAGMRARDPPDGLAVGEVGARGDRARVHDVDVGHGPGGSDPEPVPLHEGGHLLGLDLVEPAAEGREGHGGPADRPRPAPPAGASRGHAGTASLSWPHAAPMSSPLLQRTVAVIPRSRRRPGSPGCARAAVAGSPSPASR